MLVVAGAESSEVPTQTHLELRGSYSKICGVCAFRSREDGLDTTARFGVQVYGDYLPFGWYTLFGTLRAGPYGSLSAIGDIGKVAAGAAVTFRPNDASWEIFTQTGLRYTTDGIPYQSSGKPTSQGQNAFNLAIGARFDLPNQWYLSLVGEHDSNGRKIGITVFQEDGYGNPGIDSLMAGFGKVF